MQDVVFDRTQVEEHEMVEGTDLDQAAADAIEPGANADLEQAIADQGDPQELATEEAQESLEREYVKINLNSASTEELQTVSGIGPTLAARILEYRRGAGGFLSKDELLAVAGIGPTLYDAIAEHLTIVPPGAIIGAEASLEEPPPLDIGLVTEAELELEPPESASEPTAPRATAGPGEREAGPGRAWLSSALLGALLGVLAMLLIMQALNGSLVLDRTPVIVDMNHRVQELASDMGDLRGELDVVQQRLTILEGLPSRMDAVEGSVGQLDQAVGELGTSVQKLEERTDSISGRLDLAEEDIAAVQERADRVDGFFQQLQSLLTEIFGPLPSSGD